MAANFVAGSVSVLVKPYLENFAKDIKRDINAAGLDAVGRDIADDITSPIEDAAGKAGDPLKKELPKDGEQAGNETKRRLRDALSNPLKGVKTGFKKFFGKEGKTAGDEFKRNLNNTIKVGLGVGLAGIGAGGAMFLKDAIGEASDLEQSLGALDAVFKDNSGTMKQYSDEAAQTMGLSKNEYNELATLLGTQLKVGGLDGTDLTSGVQDLMVLSGDLASMFGGTSEEANTAIAALLRGETEPIRKYGVSIDQAAIQNKALEMGLVSAGEEMDASAKQQATLALLYDQTADAQGNFARENDTLAGKTARARAAFDNMKATVGEALLPVLTSAMEYVNSSVVPALENLAKGVQAVVDWITKNQDWLLPIAAAVGAIVVAYIAWVGITSLLATAQAALNAVLNANPIGLIVLAIIGLVAALVVLYHKNEWFRDFINATWQKIKDVAAAVADWFMNTALPVLKAAWDGIAAGAIWLYENAILPAWNGIKAAVSAVADWVVNSLVPWLQSAWTAIAGAAIWLWQSVIQPVWNGIKGAISAVATWITGTLVPGLQAAWTAISAAALWLYESVILPVWTAIKTAIAVVVTGILLYVDLLKWYFNNVLAPVFTWLYNAVVLPIWNAIKAAIGAVVDWFVNTALPIIQRFIDGVKFWFNVLKLALQIAWNFIKNNIVQPVLNWFTGTVVPLFMSIVGRIRQTWENFKLGLQIIWRFIRNSIIQPILNWFTGTVVPLFNSIVNTVKFYFENFKNNLRLIWNFIRLNIIQPVMNWFRYTLIPIFQNALSVLKSAFTNAKTNIQNAWTAIKDRLKSVYDNNIKPMIDRFKSAIQGLKDTFNAVKNGITEAWNKIRDAGKKPVKFVVQDIIRDGIVKKFNSVASTFGIATIDEKKFTVGWARGGILPGFTPMAQGDDVLTPMRSGEGVLVSEGLRDSRSRSAFLAANAAAKRGTSFADFLGAGYAKGGLVKLGMPFAGSYPRGDGFGARGGRHKGVDWPMPSGALLKAVAGGIVSHTRNAAAGNKLELSLGDGLVATYHHLSSYIAKAGAQVAAGADIAKVGSTGRSSGPHLHFGIKKDGKYVDPLPYLGGGGAAGSGDGGWFTNPFAGLWDSLKTKVREGVGNTPFADALFNMPKKLIDGGLNFITDKIASLGDWATETVDDAAGAARWSAVATEALVREGQFGPKRLASLLRRMGQESGYNPRAINNWDVNAKNGDPSKGLMQVIGSTFRAYRDKTLSSDIYDPLANIVASIRYTLARYGDLEKGWDRKGGYAEGGIVRPYLHDNGGYLQPGLSVIDNRTRKPEYILNQRQWDALYESRTHQRGDVNITQNIRDTDATANAIASSVSWEMNRRRIRGR